MSIGIAYDSAWCCHYHEAYQMDEMKNTARAFYWSVTLLLTLLGFLLTVAYHVPPLLLLFGAGMIVFGAWKMRPLGFEGVMLLGFVIAVLALTFGPFVVTVLVQPFAGL